MTVVLHLGLAKTGTSWLQKKVFPCLDVDFYHTSRYEAITVRNNGKPVVISFEGLSGTPYGNDRYVLAYRLWKLFPRAKVVLSIRDQEEYIVSLYCQYVRGGGTRGLCWFRRYLKDSPGFLDWDRYITHLRKLWSEVLVLPFESLRRNPISYVEVLSGFIGVPMNHGIDFSPVNESLDGRQIRSLCFLNKFFRSRWNKKGILPRWLNPYAVFQRVVKRVC